MTIAVFILFALCAVGLLAGIHWYLWRRLVRDVSAPGSVYRRVGTVVIVTLPLLTVAAQVSARSGLPFLMEQILAWPGFFWIALMLYLTMALLVGEAVRPLLLRWLDRRAARRTGSGDRTGDDGRAAPPAEPERERITVPAGAAATQTAAAQETGGLGTTTAAAAAPERTGSASDSTSSSTSGAAAGAAGAGGGSGSGAAGTGPGAPGGGPTRRLFVARTVAVAAGVAAAGTVGYGAYGVFDGPTVKRVTVPLAKLPRSGDGFRIAVVSDIHIGPILGRGHTRRIVDTINRTQPDLVAIVGDLVDGSVEDLGPAAEPLAGLRSRHGTFFVTGNHEYFSGAEQWLEHLPELGVLPLRNARAELPAFDLAGVNDVAGESHADGPDFGRALGDRDPARASVLLAHQPVQIHEAVKHGVDLQLSGHTHGGQLWPGPYLAELANPTVAGLERYGDTQLYVTRGAGAWGPPVRVGAESDITVVELASPRA